MVKLVGLTGGIGAGKSAVAGIIRAQGVPVIDADVLARAVVEPGQAAHREIAMAWPEVIGADGRIDRKRLGAIVFADPRSQKRLEAITHPRIRERVALETDLLRRAGHRIVVLEAALLVETGMYRELAGLVVVVADEETRIGRVMARDACARETVLARMAAQASHGDKLGAADYLIDNSGDLESTRDQVLAVVSALTTEPDVARKGDESARQ
jgi:dephospho-CoA kinase